jgi:hypothetical protein
MSSGHPSRVVLGGGQALLRVLGQSRLTDSSAFQTFFKFPDLSVKMHKVKYQDSPENK